MSNLLNNENVKSLYKEIVKAIDSSKRNVVTAVNSEQDTYSEKNIGNAILADLEKFILEMGRDFAFFGRQVRITVGNKDYYTRQ